MAHKRHPTKTGRPSSRPQPEKPRTGTVRGTKVPAPRAPRLPGHGMR